MCARYSKCQNKKINKIKKLKSPKKAAPQSHGGEEMQKTVSCVKESAECILPANPHDRPSMRAHTRKHAQTAVHQRRITHRRARALRRTHWTYPIHPTVCGAMHYLWRDTRPLVTVSHPAIRWRIPGKVLLSRHTGRYLCQTKALSNAHKITKSQCHTVTCG